jgi:hypothetical protein
MSRVGGSAGLVVQRGWWFSGVGGSAGLVGDGFFSLRYVLCYQYVKFVSRYYIVIMETWKQKQKLSISRSLYPGSDTLHYVSSTFCEGA